MQLGNKWATIGANVARFSDRKIDEAVWRNPDEDDLFWGFFLVITVLNLQENYVDELDRRLQGNCYWYMK